MADTPDYKFRPQFCIQELIREATREAALRRRAYPKWVRAGRMNQKDADKRIEMMDAIVSRLTRTAGQ